MIHSLSIAAEVDYIIGKARESDGRVVTLGPLVFFSTGTGDAWVLDPEDSLALCLACDGSACAFHIEETRDTFAVAWSHEYRIDAKTMTFVDRGGNSKVVMGYPTRDIARAVRGMKARERREP